MAKQFACVKGHGSRINHIAFWTVSEDRSNAAIRYTTEIWFNETIGDDNTHDGLVRTLRIPGDVSKELEAAVNDT